MLSGKKGFCSKMSSSRLGVLVNNNRECVVCSAARLWFYIYLSYRHPGRVLASTNVFQYQPQLSATTRPDADAGWLLQVQKPG